MAAIGAARTARTARPRPAKSTRPKKARVGTEYQGREIQSTIQANTLAELNRMISGMRTYAKRHRMGPVKVLSKGRDPDGGYKAVLTAHNSNRMDRLLWGTPHDPVERKKMLKGLITPEY